MLLGAHVSAAGGLDRAIDRIEALAGDALQLFTQSPRRWKPSEHDPATIERFLARRREAGVRYVACHALYLINLATRDRALYRRSAEALLATVDVAVRIESDVVFHVGSHGDADLAPSLDRIRRTIGTALERVLGKQLAVLLGHRAFRTLPAILETPGRDGKGPDALEMRRLRRLCSQAGIPFQERPRVRRRRG
jgi:deoxyribonuclease-4